MNDAPQNTIPDKASWMLSLIEEFFLEADRKEARDLYNVLCALRGPDWPEDGGENRIKEETTMILRRAAFPAMMTYNQDSRDGRCEVVVPLGCLIARASETTPVNEQPIAAGAHFGYHVRDAVWSLKSMGRLTSDGRLPTAVSSSPSYIDDEGEGEGAQ